MHFCSDARLLAALCLLIGISGATPVGTSKLQAPLEHLAAPDRVEHQQHQQHQQASQLTPRTLHGRFLHITDLHPDPYYTVHASTEEGTACHRGVGVAGIYGAETSDCDSPFALLDATFDWIKENVKDSIDFVIWTGDSARHDSDEQIPRTQTEVLDTNRRVAEKFVEVFGESDDLDGRLAIPVVSTFGNNDILPHNILLSGPNRWLKTYTDIWSSFIPEEQRHGFEKGGWYYVEVIPKKLAVFSLNTLYFFDRNAAVDGCDMRSEPGYDHFEWLRIQLQFVRERGMKAILIGHVPPARTESKQLWDETCWQKYTLWLQQYRDVIVGGLYGHMNIDHFMIQDTNQLSFLNEDAASQLIRATMDDELTIQSADDYLEELRENWSGLPNPSSVMDDPAKNDLSTQRKKKTQPTKKEKLLKEMGGPWAERFQLTLVSPSLVPNYLPTIRIVEYNISGLDPSTTWASVQRKKKAHKKETLEGESNDRGFDDVKTVGKKNKKPKNPDWTIPSAPSKGAPPGPAYSPQTLTLTGYTQYFANLTHINNDHFASPEEGVDAEKWRGGKHKGKKTKNKKPHPKPFKFKKEYSTFNDSIYQLEDLTVRSYIKLAHRIGQYKPSKGDSIDTLNAQDEVKAAQSDYIISKGKDHKKKRHHKQHEKNKVWLRFVRRAFVGTLDEKELSNFEIDSEMEDKIVQTTAVESEEL